MSKKPITLFISGGSRGIGLAIALRAAREGANVVIAAKTDAPHPKLEGTIHTAASAIEAAGGRALAVVCDIRDEQQVAAAVAQAVERFGGIDVLVNNASAIQLTDTASTDMKRYDLMAGVNARGTFLCGKYCLPHLKQSANPHILTLSPPLDMNPKWFAPYAAYAIAKFGMSLCTLAWSEEFRPLGIAANSLWPHTTIATAAVNAVGGEHSMRLSRTPDIMAEAAWEIINRPSREFTGNFCIDDLLLRDAGHSSFSHFAAVPGTASEQLQVDLFVPEDTEPPLA